ncbi:unnamed protein product [Blepharisma stoltei]|uniref:Uncharacterized protein n=1 Tax=Blepharisma stoltei TaxID=1481888 RepID=A0AAU9KL29_9CILI|nr:unnamed protein product [Blepharisma stoltei]
MQVKAIIAYSTCVLIYFVCLSGFIYDLITRATVIGFDLRKNRVEYVHRGHREQYGGEGIVMSFLICLCGCALVGINNLRKLPPWIVRIGGLFCLMILVFSYRKVIEVYRIKMPWYGPGFYPPSHYVKGPLINDQGYSI